MLEAVLRELVAAEQRIELRHGCTVDALAMNADRSAVTGLRVGAREVAADLVIDAAGARGPVRGWLAEATGRPLVRPPAENRLTYVGRWFEATTPPPRLDPLLINHASWSLLTLPSDGGAYAVVLVVGSRDRAARDLHDPERWTAAVRCDPVGAAWIDHGRPVTPVEVHGGFDRGDGQTASRETEPGVVGAGMGVAESIIRRTPGSRDRQALSGWPITFVLQLESERSNR